jgi:hypothetical protein
MIVDLTKNYQFNTGMMPNSRWGQMTTARAARICQEENVKVKIEW